MQKIRLCVHTSGASEVLGVVQDMGVVEFSEVESKKLSRKEKTNFEFNYASSRLDFAVEFLSRYDTAKGKLRSLIEGTNVVAREEEIERIAKTFSYNDIIDHLESLEQDLNRFKKKIASLEKEQALLGKWRALNMPLGRPLETARTKTVFVEKKGVSKNRDIDEDVLGNIFQKEGMHFSYRACEGAVRGLVTFFLEDAERAQKLLGAVEYDIVEMPKRRGTPEEELERIARAIRNTEKRIAQCEADIRTYLPQLPKLKILSDAMLWKKDKHNTLASAQTTESVLVFEGWCYKEKLEELRKRIAEKTSYFSLAAIDRKKGEKTPVAIENAPAIKPFETITRLYGLPGYKEFDPTIFLAGFFFLFFGLCLTDVFYGLFIFAMTAAVLYFYRVPESSKPLIKLLMFGGISSSIIGLFFGGYLGISPESLPGWARALQQFDPIANPLPIFYLSLALGFIQILFGIFLKMMTKVRNGKALDGVLDDGSWMVFFVVLLFFGAQQFGLIEGAGEAPTMALYGATALLVITQGRKEKTILKKLFSGVSSLYGLVGYFSDVLSYSRLLALGLATTALAFAINLIAEIVGDMIPYVGPVLAVLILVGGHLFNLAINTLGAFIHSARLQFVEFFGKFIVGGGRAMVPFAREERYVVLEKRDV